MPDLSEWAWLIVVVVWFLIKAVGRLFRSKSASPQAARPGSTVRAPAERAPERFGDERERQGDVPPAPIQPK